MAAFPSSPIAGVTVPSTDLTRKAFAFVQKHNTPATANHSTRSVLFALVIAPKMPHLANVDPEIITIAGFMHDLGWSTTPALISPDKRFEVDGANVARDFIRENAPKAL